MTGQAKELASRVTTVRRSARWERYRSRLPRYLLAGAAAVLSLLGARDLIAADSVANKPTTSAQGDHASEEFAQRFARAYLTYDPARPDRRERSLASLAPDDLAVADAPLPSRSQSVDWTEIAQNQEAIAGGRVIVVSVGLSTQPEPLYLAVPIYRDGGGAIGLAGYPSLVGPPTTSRADLGDRVEVEDPELAEVARRVVTNYLARERRNLAADLAPHVVVSLPTRELAVRSVEDVTWADGVGSSALLITVTARDSLRFEWTLTYELGIQQSGERPFVTFVETVPNSP